MGRWGIALMILGAGAACLWTLRVAPQPGADICIFQRESADALLHGNNPYALTFEDPYASKSSFYGDGLVQDGRLQFGYPYPPLPLLMALPGHLFGDFRFSMLVAIVASGALIAGMRPGRVAPLAAGFLLFTPRGLFVLEAGWIEPLVVVLFAAVVFAACRHRGSKAGTIVLGILAGLLFASKQYLIVAAPLLWLLPVVRDRATRRRFLFAMIATGLIVTLPLALWNPKAFLWSAAVLQFHQPFRPDALSYLVPLRNIWLQSDPNHPPSMLKTLLLKPPAWIALSIAPIVAIVCARRLRPTPPNFAAAMALTLLVLFAINKQAFCNYYYLVIGALASAIAAGATELKREEVKT
jgi:4-amino-4-deoxy-L-arabinose transferase-like glycosyltransferase